MCPLLKFHCCGHDLGLNAYATCISLAMLVLLLGGWGIAALRGLPRGRVFVCLLAIVVAAFAGARLLYAALHADMYRQTPGLLLSPDVSRFALQGGLIAGLAIGLLGCWRLKIDAWALADAAAPAIAVGLVLIRTGCFLNGCCFGKETTVPWGIVFPVGSPAHLHQISNSLELLFESPRPVHPTQLYEVAAAAAAALIAVLVYRISRLPGNAFLLAAIWMAAFQWLNAGLRAEIGPSSPRSAYAWFHVGFVILGLLVLAYRIRAWRQAVASQGTRGEAD